MVDRMNDYVTNDQVGEKKMTDQKHCFSCATLMHQSAGFCPKCGAAQPGASAAMSFVDGSPQALAGAAGRPVLAANHVYCRGCGRQIHETAYSCPQCGAPQNTNNQAMGLVSPSGGRTKIAAALFALFLGGFGGHKFYLGQIGMGIVYLLFFWTFIPALVSLVEGILFLLMSDSDFNRKYN